MKKGYVQSRTTYSSTTRPPADNPDQVVLVCQGVLHSERSSAIPTTRALARGPGTNHVARDLVFERPIRYSDTSPWGGLVVGRGRVAEVVRGQRGPPTKKFGLGRKSLDLDENFKPEHTLFCHELRFAAIYALFGDFCANKVPFWFKNSVSLARSAPLHGIYCIFH